MLSDIVSIINWFMNWLDKHGSVVLAIITAYYAWQNRKYVKLIEEDRRRQQIQLLTNSFLYPLLIELEEDLKKLSENKFIRSIHKKTKKLPEMVFLDIGYFSYLFETHEYNSYKFLIPQNYRSKMENFKEEYLNSLEALRRQIREVAENIPESFVETVSNLINEFKKNYELPTFGNDKIEDAYYFLQLIIEGKEEVRDLESLEKFWELNKNKIRSELFKDKKIKEKIEEIWEKKQEVVKIVKNYKEVVEELINKWVKDYGLLLPTEAEVKRLKQKKGI